MDITKLKKIKKKIETLDSYHHIEILSILKRNNIKYSENKNGVFVNMNVFTKEIVSEIQKFIEYVDNQEKTLENIELKKNSYKKDYFKENKEKVSYLN
tara:strand:- start:169 stop:462 length:294 start_codon:yes stop_codon:yes gene_type:complete